MGDNSTVKNIILTSNKISNFGNPTQFQTPLNDLGKNPNTGVIALDGNSTVYVLGTGNSQNIEMYQLLSESGEFQKRASGSSGFVVGSPFSSPTTLYVGITPDFNTFPPPNFLLKNFSDASMEFQIVGNSPNFIFAQYSTSFNSIIGLVASDDIGDYSVEICDLNLQNCQQKCKNVQIQYETDSFLGKHKNSTLLLFYFLFCEVLLVGNFVNFSKEFFLMMILKFFMVFTHVMPAERFFVTFIKRI